MSSYATVPKIKIKAFNSKSAQGLCLRRIACSVERSFILEGISRSILKEFNKDLPPHHTHTHTVAVRDGLAISFAFRPGAGGPIQSILKLKASILG